MREGVKRLVNQKRINNYILSFAGIIIFLLLIYLAGHIEQRLQLMLRETYQGLKIHFYSTVINFAVLLVATSALGLSKMVCVRAFDWKLFVIFAVSGAFLSFINFLPFISPFKISLSILLSMGKYSKLGGVVAGVGIILSTRGKPV